MILRRLLLDNEPSDGGTINTVSKPGSGMPTQIKVSVPKAVPEAVKAMTFKGDMNLLTDTDKVGFTMEDTSKSNVDNKPEIVEPQRTAQPEVVKAEPEVKKAEPTAKTSATVTQPQKVEQAKVNEPQPIVPKKKGVAEPVKEFDYTGFAEEEASALRQMSTAGRDFTVGLLKKNKELAQVKDGMFAQHPDAYVIDPSFRSIQDDAHYASVEAQLWQEQLQKIETGEEWTPLRGFDKSGNPVFGPAQKPTAQDKYQVGLLMNRAHGLAEQKKGELQHFAATYQQRVQGDNRLIQAEREKRFGWVKNPEILKETVELDDGTEKSVSDIRSILINQFPPYLRNTLPVEVAADLFAALQIYGQTLREATKGKTVAETQVREVARAEPTGGQRNSDNVGGKSINGIKEFSLAGMPR